MSCILHLFLNYTGLIVLGLSWLLWV